MWELYDELIAAIPENMIVTDYMAGVSWTCVRSGDLMGVACTVKSYDRMPMHDGPIMGAKLRDIAALVKSWNFVEASIGAAALNAWHNRPEQMLSLGCMKADLPDKSLRGRKQKDAFIAFADSVAGKKVAVIGHFPNIEQQFRGICELSILEREPRRDDYPDSACDYILAEQDFVFITGMTYVNKTLEHLLRAVGQKTRISLVGPSIPVSPFLLRHGIHNISGFCVTEQEYLLDHIRRGSRHTIFHGGRMVSLGEGTNITG